MEYLTFNQHLRSYTRLVYRFNDVEKRELSFEDWIVFVLTQNKHKYPWNSIDK